MASGTVENLYTKYGSIIASGVAECLYDHILADESLTPYFQGIDMDELTDHMADLLCMVTGGPDLYKGKDIKSAHASMKIDKPAFMKVVGHLIQSFVDLDIAPEDGQLIIDVLAQDMDKVVTR